MNADYRVTTIDCPERYGGLLICGTNYGLLRGQSPKPEISGPPYAEYFSHYASNRKNDKFVNGLVRWFSLWNIPLETEDKKPTELNQAISQTNLFYDFSKTFSERSTEEMAFAFTRLERIIQKYDISGILFASSKIETILNEDSWKHPEGLRLDKRPEKRRFWVRFGFVGSVQIALLPHPASIPKSKSGDESVSSKSDEMNKWIGNVMSVYKKKQPMKKG